MTFSMKDELLARLLRAGGEPISGQQLANDFGVSRTAIWKHIQVLQEEGYILETVKKKGYVLKSAPDRMDAARIQTHLETERIGQVIHHFGSVDSTQILAHGFVRDGAADGTVVIAEEQTAGRGRMLRPWESTAGKGVWMTVILKPDIPPHQAPQFTLVAAVSIVNAMKALYPELEPEIKWPNDILLNGRKCTGILTEMVAEADRIQALLIGIGINVNQKIEDFPQELHTIATSISAELGREVDRAEFVAKVLYYLESYGDQYVKNGFSPIKALWEKASATIGRHVRATTLREVIEGVAVGITEAGVLEIKTASGEVKGVYSADIELC
ncbi:biotin--[acetyl-CoA-carboxylase] ligase [Lysinibacillus odysseyi]|uniref:Bifunctional ligase/repressor BirA n=1 Tax=Lysinibacillus odysseyi 34hs-1 = NBRC 100172 TaxID=1220589 RepID=A0A0A3IQ43_9BACI|nr:biotin--[acetyl-CoA-carboxylase] ligase [Lysinibacillus odysseyi]KGR84993.1 biotin--acetyl-CoA-carboxylase ligase [Lysinibacillus odysseyi 34hs-1 = NBRC 100172]